MIERLKTVIRAFFPKNAFLRGVSVLVGGTAGAQILLLLAAPLLTRLYTPEDFGLLAVYASLLAIIGVVASLRYELAIPLPEDDNESANLVVLCLILVVVISILTGVAMLIWGDSLAERLGVPALANCLWFLPLGVLLTGFYTVFNYWGIRTKRFGDIATTKLNQALATLAIQLTGFNLGGIALLMGQVAGQTAGTLTLAMPALKNTAFKQISLAKMKFGLLRYKEFPLYSTWSGLINTAGHQLPPLIFAAFFSAGAAGLYALANRLLAMPANLIGGALAQVFLSHGVDSHREGNLGLIYAKLQNTLIQIGLPPTMLIVLVSPELFVVVFGQAWRDAGVFAQWLAVGAFFGFVVSPLSQIFTITEQQKLGFLLQMLLFISRLIGISIGIAYDSAVLAMALFSIGSAFGYGMYIIVMGRILSAPLADSLLVFLKRLAVSFVACLPALFAVVFITIHNVWLFWLLVLFSVFLVSVLIYLSVKMSYSTVF